MILLQFKIQECSAVIAKIEEIEFKLIEHGMTNERRLTRLIKRALILKQTDYWNELDAPIVEQKKEKKRAKRR